MKKTSRKPEDSLQLPLFASPPTRPKPVHSLETELQAFKEFGKETVEFPTRFEDSRNGVREIRTFVNEFWTARQRAANALHEVAYRACFKPQLPRFFIERLTRPGDVVYDPFMGRGTALVEAALMGRIPYGCDINPLSLVLVRPRLNPPEAAAVIQRLNQISLADHDEYPEELLVFFHPETLRQICSLKKYLLARRASGKLDALDEWISMVALNRLTGHSPGFFSVYTLPPNQAVSVKSQIRINEKRQQAPTRKDIAALIAKRTRQLQKELSLADRETLARVGPQARLVNASAAATPQILDRSVSLVVTSPPFLNIVAYALDNWMRCWFLGIDAKAVKLTMATKVEVWKAEMTRVFQELHRVLKPGGHVAFEVGEVRKGTVKLEEEVLPCGEAAGLEPKLVLINDQVFTKTANCWGVDNNAKGTNTNRIVVFTKTG